MKFKSHRYSCPHCGLKGRNYHEGPDGYIAWHEWAEKMGENYNQLPCPGCGRLTIWKKK